MSRIAQPLTIDTLDQDIADLQADIDAKKATLARLKDDRKAAQRRLDDARALAIGRLACAAGLAAVPDERLEKFFLTYEDAQHELSS